jgi:uncharacterized protein (DUF1800 family)
MTNPNPAAIGGDAIVRQEASPFANTVLPKLVRTTSGLEPYTGAWGREEMAHLLRRTMFGATRADIAALSSLTAAQAVDALLFPPAAETSEPLSYEAQDVAIAVGTTWVNAVRQATGSTYNPTTVRTNSLKAWWISLMLNQQRSIREKMVLFWHNHFVTATASVGEPRFSYRYLAMLRANALGNFKTMARLATLEGAMLRYLNGNVNTKSSPNENYGRELQELFTIGKGPEVGPGDYTNYTEADVKAAARVLTGWKDYTKPDGTIDATTYTFNSNIHDTNAKVFSARYGGVTIVGGTDASRELDDLLKMIFDQWETAKFLCRKLYRWFVYYTIDDWTEANVITPLANTLRANNFEILPVLRQLFKSAHFFDPLNRSCIIKSPLDFFVGLCREAEITFPAADVTKQYPLWNYVWTQSSAMQQNILDPPDVSGWHAYYQEPQFHELWINSDTLPKRMRLTDLLSKNGYTTAGVTIVIDVVALAKRTSNPSDPNVLVDELARTLFAIPITVAQRAFLKNTLLPGLPDYEWSVEWAEYIADPTNSAKLAAVKGKLQSMVKVMMQMPEFQLM